MDTAKRSVGSSHGVPPIANAMETPLSALVVLPSRSLRRVLIPPICELIALISVKDARPRPAAVLVALAVPNAIWLGAVAVAPAPMALEFAKVAEAPGPMAVALRPVAIAPSPKAAPPFAALAATSTATEPVATAPLPIAMELTPVLCARHRIGSERSGAEADPYTVRDRRCRKITGCVCIRANGCRIVRCAGGRVSAQSDSVCTVGLGVRVAAQRRCWRRGSTIAASHRVNDRCGGCRRVHQGLRG